MSRRHVSRKRKLIFSSIVSVGDSMSLSVEVNIDYQQHPSEMVSVAGSIPCQPKRRTEVFLSTLLEPMKINKFCFHENAGSKHGTI